MPSNEFFHGYTPVASSSQHCLERPRIYRLLEKAVQKPIVAVVAGAGCGKTHAVYSFVRKYNARTAWMQCSERDNIAKHFWDNFVSAVSKTTGQQFDRFLEVPKNAAIPNEKYILVFDDLHLIAEKTVLSFLEQYISSAFPNITSILISRVEPPIDLAKQAAKKNMARIGGEELLFSKNEMVSYFKLQQISPSPRTVSAIYHDTEGWAFAIHLAGLALKNSIAAAYVPQILRSNVFMFIESEVMANIPPELRRFLIKLSLVENHSLELLMKIGKEKIGEDISLDKEMEGMSSFIRFDSGQNSFHVHHLLMGYLADRQDELSEEEKKDVWASSADHYAAKGQKSDAIISYEKAGDYDSIVNILYSLPLVLPEQTARLVLDVLGRAPENIFRDYPETAVIRKRLLVPDALNLGFIGKIVPHSAEAMGSSLTGMSELVEGELAFFRGKLGEAENCLLEAIKKARKAEQVEIENYSLFYLLRIHLNRGEAKEIEGIILQLEAAPEKESCQNRHSYLNIFLGWYYIQTGKKDRIAPWLKSEYEKSGISSRACGLEGIVKAKYFFAEKRYPAALVCLENQAHMKISLMGGIAMKALEAVCRYRLSDKEGAFKALGEAYRLASPRGLFMPFTELGKDMRALAEAAIRDKAPALSPEWLRETRRNAAVYAKKLHRQSRLAGPGNGERPLLSRREREVLIGFSQGLTREEIADAASISPNTVKSATKSIFNKLGALNQADAVRIAAEKGFL